MKLKRFSIIHDAFSLVELIIVVAILALLALVAVPNLLESQARSKVARVASDMRTIAVGLEAYQADAGAYPPAARGDVQLVRPLVALTEPVAYVEGVPEDPFGPAPFDFDPDIVMPGYEYKDKVSTSQGMPAETYGEIWVELPEKEYFLHSAGPNRIWNVMPFVDYDPTNGTISAGDIIRLGPF